MIYHSVTNKLISLCGSLEQAESLVCEARKKGDKGHVLISMEVMRDTKDIVINDLRKKARNYFKKGK